MRPKFSIITVSYNSAATIRTTIESVLGQTCRDFEYILVDGASTDGTVEIIEEYAGRNPDKIRYVSEPDDGIYQAMNKGIRMSKGSIIGILNSDDWYERDALEKVFPYIRNEGEYVLYGMVRFWDNDRVDRIIMNSHESLKIRMMLHPACFVSRSAYVKYGRYDERYRSAADCECFLRFQKNQVEFIPIPEILANFRLGGMSSSYTSHRETNMIYRKYGYLTEKQYIIRMLSSYIKYKLLKLS